MPHNNKPIILIIDDERNTREGLKTALADKYDILLAEDAVKGISLLKNNNISIVLTDLRMPGMDGMDFIREVVSWKKHPLIIMLTAYGSVQTAVQAMKAGAYDYISKPVDLDNLEVMLDRGLQALVRERGEQNTPAAGPLASIVAVSKPMKHVMDSVAQVADTKATVLITGESGTGKEVIAMAIHKLSSRASKPFVAVHCAALNENLLESELFGHEKGAFTGATERVPGRFETAADGTLFLDEIGEISLPTQVKLLRVLENRTFERVGGKTQITVNARLVAATNRDLAAMVKEGTFREDLFYRLNVVTIDIPPLRARKEDIPALLDFFLRKCNEENDKHIAGFSPEAITLLTAYDWPGNVRELRNCVERMTVFSRGSILTLGDVPSEIRQNIGHQFDVENARKQDNNASANANANASANVSAPSALSGGEQLNVKANEKALIIKALAECNGNRSHAAEKLNISRRTLQRKLHEYNIS